MQAVKHAEFSVVQHKYALYWVMLGLVGCFNLQVACGILPAKVVGTTSSEIS